MNKARLYLISAVIFFNNAANASDLFNSSIEELANLKITSASKVAEEIFKTPSASYIITSEDIKRSGATTLPEILRFAPGIEVAQISANKWAVSARGFTDQLSNKLLVLIDGRSVYTPHFSGVYWEIQDTLLEDIDRIEIIRGSGAALWGANAVNGVINIITKKSKDTQGSYFSSGFGNLTQNVTEGRFGGKINDSVYYRTYAKYSKFDDLESTSGANANDGWDMTRGGFRVDFEKSPTENLTLQGDLYNGIENKGRHLTYPTLTAPFSTEVIDYKGGDIGGGNIIGRWEKNLYKGSDLKLQFYYDNARRDYSDQSILSQTLDSELQHSFTLGDRHNILWGIGARYNMESNNSSTYFNYQNDHKYYTILNTFVQDKMPIFRDNIFLTLGSKFEYNTFSGLEIQPSVKLAWNISDRQILWGAISRSVRTPSRAETDLQLVVGVSQGPPAGYLVWQGNEYFKAEELISYEVGYRDNPAQNFSYDVSLFYNDYSNLRTYERGAIFPNSTTAMLLPFRNNGYGESYGIEVSSNYDVMENWRLSANYSFITIDLHKNPASADTVLQSLEGNSPKNRFNIRSLVNLGDNVELDNTLYYVDNLSSRHISAYTRFDSRIAWKPCKNLELSLTGNNLLDNRHSEFTGSLFSSQADIPRSVYGKVVWRY